MAFRRSKYDLINAWNYMRLAYQSMSKDQEEASRVVSRICETLETPEARLRALTKIIARQVK